MTGRHIILTAWAALEAESDLDSGSVRRVIKPKLRAVTIAEILGFVVISVMVITLLRIIMVVCVNDMLLVNILVLVHIFVLILIIGVTVAIPRLRRSSPSDQSSCQKSNYHNLSDVFHFDPPFIRISRATNEIGYRSKENMLS